MLSSGQDESDKFFHFREHLVKQYKAGDSRVRGMLDSAPVQSVDKNKSVSVTTSDKGKMKLLRGYKDEYGCSPSKNGHKVREARVPTTRNASQVNRKQTRNLRKRRERGH